MTNKITHTADLKHLIVALCPKCKTITVLHPSWIVFHPPRFFNAPCTHCSSDSYVCHSIHVLAWNPSNIEVPQC